MILTEADIAAFAEVLMQRPRKFYGGGTAIGDAILYAAHALETKGFEGRRRIINVSRDGPDRNGFPAVVGRDQAVAQGVTMNGLPPPKSFCGRTNPSPTT